MLILYNKYYRHKRENEKYILQFHPVNVLGVFPANGFMHILKIYIHPSTTHYPNTKSGL